MKTRGQTFSSAAKDTSRSPSCVCGPFRCVRGPLCAPAGRVCLLCCHSLSSLLLFTPEGADCIWTLKLQRCQTPINAVRQLQPSSGWPGCLRGSGRGGTLVSIGSFSWILRLWTRLFRSFYYISCKSEESSSEEVRLFLCGGTASSLLTPDAGSPPDVGAARFLRGGTLSWWLGFT